DGRRERELDPGQDPRVDRALHRPAGEEIGHRQRERGQGEEEAPPEPPRHVDELRVGLVAERRDARLERHAADGAAPRLAPHDLGVHRADVLGRPGHPSTSTPSRRSCASVAGTATVPAGWRYHPGSPDRRSRIFTIVNIPPMSMNPNGPAAPFIGTLLAGTSMPISPMPPMPPCPIDM